MATNFTVILFQRQHFGNEPGIFNDIEPSVPFAGSTKDFSFDCRGVNPSETAFLIFQSRDVDHQRNIFQINGVDVFGGLPASPAKDAWNGNILLIGFWCKRLKRPVHCRNARDDGIDLGTRSLQGAAF